MLHLKRGVPGNTNCEQSITEAVYGGGNYSHADIIYRITLRDKRNFLYPQHLLHAIIRAHSDVLCTQEKQSVPSSRSAFYIRRHKDLIFTRS